jgi:hypothetical protein
MFSLGEVTRKSYAYSKYNLFHETEARLCVVRREAELGERRARISDMDVRGCHGGRKGEDEDEG